jgi:hypothetical protein
MDNSISLKKKIIIGFILAILSITPTTLILLSLIDTDLGPDFTIVGGNLTEDTTWEGFISVQTSVDVPSGITLTILPGTYIEFRHYRGYKGGTTVGLSTTGGDIIAIGTPDEQIWFTSDAEEPVNGDWSGIYCSNTNSSIFRFVIVEFGIVGIEAENSKLNISHSIIRWIHTEGIYSSASTVLFEYNRIYENGYHELSLENFNPNITVRYNIFNGGHYGIYSEASNVTIVGNYFVNYTGTAISGSLYSNLTIISNRFENVGDQIDLGATVNNVSSGNDLTGSGTVPIPILEFEDPQPRPLGYIPGDLEDKYLYVYDDIDETREIIHRLEGETTFDWTLAYVNESLWKFEHRSFMGGPLQDFVRINLTSEEKEIFGNEAIPNPNGLAYDGDYFWTYDIVLRKIFQFKPNASNFIEIEGTFNIPPEVSSVVGVATDGSHIYLSGGGGSKIYKMNKTMSLVETINLSGGSILGGFTWTGSYFWANSEILLTKWYMNGSLAGKIYPVAVGTIGITWDGSYIWTSQKTCELWYDAKIFQIDVINDQFIE